MGMIENDSGRLAPRHVIRGANGPVGALGIGWLQGSLSMQWFDALRDLLFFQFGECEVQKRWLFFRDTVLVYSNGVLLAYDDGTGEDLADRCVVSIPATALETLPPEGLLSLLHALCGMQFRCTRIDESYDDFRWRITPEAVLAVVQAGDVAGFKTYSHAGGGVIGGESKGFTTYLGKRGDNGGGKLGRIYDKRVESRGAIDAVRWEVEWSKLKASKVFEDLAGCTNVDDLARMVAMHIGGAFDFPIRAGGKGHVYRCDRHDWWVELFADLGGGVKIRVERKTPAYEAAKAAFRFQYAPLLSVIEEVEGKAGAAEFLRVCKEEGLGRQGVRHRRMVIEAVALRGDRVA